MIKSINSEPWVELPTERDFAGYGTQQLIAFNQQLRQSEKYRFYQLVFDFIVENRIHGDYHEFGSHRCRTFRMALSEARRRALDAMRFLAYDSFEGLPPVSSSPSQETWQPGALATSREEFLRLVREHGIYVDHVELIPGFFDKTLSPGLAARLGSKAAFVCIDCDLYESAIPIFRYLPEIVTDGSVVYIDDYFTGYRGSSRDGVARAFRESEIERQFHVEPFLPIGWWGRSFILHQR